MAVTLQMTISNTFSSMKKKINFIQNLIKSLVLMFQLKASHHWLS